MAGEYERTAMKRMIQTSDRDTLLNGSEQRRDQQAAQENQTQHTDAKHQMHEVARKKITTNEMPRRKTNRT